METRVHQLIPQPSTINLDLLLAPGMGRTKFGEQPHGPAFQTRTPVLMIDHARLFEFLVARPWPNRPFVELLMDIGESCTLDPFGHLVEGVDASTGPFATGQDIRAPVVQDVIGRQAAVISLDQRANL